MKRQGNMLQRMYGFDSLSIFLILICCILNLITFIRPLGSFLYLGPMGLLLLIVCVIRGISADYEQRQKENETFLGMIRPLTKGLDRWEEERGQRKMFRFFDCPDCRQRICVPKGKGRIEITCPECGTKFIKKT